MAIQMSTTLRNNRLDSIETTIGTAAKVSVWTGAAPANCAAANSGTKLAEWTLASDWAAAASSGSKSLSGTPLSTTGLAAGTAAHFRLHDNAGTTCHMQGTVTASGGGGDMTVDNTSVAVGQTVQITSWSWTEPGA
jgi:hypothetical protein